MRARVTLIGAGSGYTPLIVRAISRSAPPGVRMEYMCVDPDEARLAVVSGYTAALLEDCLLPHATIERASEFGDAEADADIVISLFRVGGLPARRLDEARARRHGVLAQETQGWVGFASALRNVPAITAVSSKLRDVGSRAWHVIASNPVGILTTAASSERPERTVGVCDMPQKLINAAARVAGVPLEDFRASYLGLNHCGWLTGARTSEGRNVLARLLREPYLSRILGEASGANIPQRGDLAGVCAEIGALPSPYLRYYYARSSLLASGRDNRLRAEECLDIDRRLIAAYRHRDFHSAEELVRRRGGSGVARVIADAIWQCLLPSATPTFIACAPDARVPHVHPRASVELYGEPHDAPEDTLLHPAVQGLIERISAYEVMAADAARSGNHAAILAAAAMNPWIEDESTGESLLRETLAEQADLLPQLS